MGDTRHAATRKGLFTLHPERDGWRAAAIAFLGEPVTAVLPDRRDGTVYAARGSVHDAAGVAGTKRMLRRAFETQGRGGGFSFVEVLTMCPTGWFVPTAEGPGYMDRVLGSVHVPGELKVDGRLVGDAAAGG